LPTITDSDSSSAVIFIMLVRWIATALFHTGPSSIFFGSLSWSGRPMFERSFSTHLSVSTPARSRTPALQMLASSNMSLAAITSAVPHYINMIFGSRSARNNYESPETLSGDIMKFSHVATSYSNLVRGLAGGTASSCILPHGE
jgi:hypothetical protein